MRIFTGFTLLVAIVAVTVLPLGCVQQPAATPGGASASSAAKDSSAQPAAPKAAEQAKAKPAPKKETPKKKKPAPPKYGKELVENGTFDKWESEFPTGWEADKIKTLSKLDKAEKGVGFELTPDSEAIQFLKQRVTVYNNGKNRTYEARMRGKASEEEALLLSLRYIVDGECKYKTVSHLGSGNWEDIVNEITVPKEAKLSAIEVRVGVRNTAKEDVVIEDVSLRERIR